MAEIFDGFVGRTVVLDMTSRHVFLGVLAEVHPDHVVLDTVDVHDLRDTGTTKDLYVMETARHGVRENRRRVRVSRCEIVAVSALEDVIVF